MWRWISGIPRAIRQHLHGPRASATNVYADDEPEETKNERTKQQDVKEKYKHFTCRTNLGNDKKEKSRQGPDHEKTFNKQQHCDFWSLFHNHHCTLEALGWGAAVVLGIQLTKHPLWTKSVEQDEHRPRHCLLYRVAYALPGTSSSVKKSVIETDKKLHVDTDEPPKAQKTDPLTEVMNQFEDMCKKYTGIGRNVEGLLKASKGDFKSATDAWKDASQLGYVKSQYNLGLCYEIGKGVSRNLQEAIKHYGLAAEEGHPQAFYNMALIYLKGENGVEKNPRLAISLLEKAAELGLTQAQTYLGVHYTESETQEMEKAVSFFKAAADQNDPEAQYFLGICYEQGWGVEVNECKAADLYAQAASSGHDGAIYNLAVFHHHGLGGLPEDHVSAKDLFGKAAAAGNQNAKLWLQTPDAYLGPSDWQEQDIRTDDSLASIHPDTKQHEKDLMRMNSSTSSPSLTDYIRKHLDELEIGQFTEQPLKNIGLFGMASLPVDQSILSSNSLSNWQPQYGSPKLASSPTETDERVFFSIGADEDDLDSLNGLNASLESLSWEMDPNISSHRFCSMIQRNSTMPNLQTVSCN